MVTRNVHSNFKSFTQDEYIGSKLETYIKTGLGAEGYRSDPWMTEMKIVFPEKFDIIHVMLLLND